VTSLVALCAFVLACYGWGSVAYALFYPGRDPFHAYIITLGLVVQAFMGGLLNAIHMASTLPVSICIYTGILLGFFIVRLGSSIKWRSFFAPARLPEWVSAIAIISLGIFLVATLLPTSVFNFHDDFLTYLPRVVRMRETGTLGGNPFEVLGLTDLGVQAFFQGVMSTWLPIQYTYAFDTIFCFVLGLWLLVEFGRNNKCTITAIMLPIANRQPVPCLLHHGSRTCLSHCHQDSSGGITERETVVSIGALGGTPRRHSRHRCSD
jgi:hypothetical protein